MSTYLVLMGSLISIISFASTDFVKVQSMIAGIGRKPIEQLKELEAKLSIARVSAEEKTIVIEQLEELKHDLCGNRSIGFLSTPIIATILCAGFTYFNYVLAKNTPDNIFRSSAKVQSLHNFMQGLLHTLFFLVGTGIIEEDYRAAARSLIRRELIIEHKINQLIELLKKPEILS